VSQRSKVTTAEVDFELGRAGRGGVSTVATGSDGASANVYRIESDGGVAP
jgi:hypothetical protein